MDSVVSYIAAKGDKNSGIGTVGASEAAVFIIRGIPAVAIGGFSGGDPIFTADSFETMAARTKLRYFLLSPGDGLSDDNPLRSESPQGGQAAILNRVTQSWQDISADAGLPPATLFHNPVQ